MAITDVRVVEQDLADGDLRLQARDGESLEIVARGISGADADTTIEEYVREELMTAYPADEGDESLLLEETVRRQHRDFLGTLSDRGFRVPTISVPEGQVFTLTSTTDTGHATIVYREAGVGAAGQSQPGGPGTKNRTFISSGRVEADLTAEAGPRNVDVETSVQPAQLDDWPFGEDVPPNREYDLQAFAIRASADSTDTGAALESFRLTSDETDFLARQSAMVSAELAQFPNADLTTMPMLFADEPTFSPGADLDISARVSGANDGTVVVDCLTVWYRRAV